MRQAAAQIFLVGNDPELLATLSGLLRADDIAIRLAPSGDGIFELLRDHPADLVLLEGSRNGIAAGTQGGSGHPDHPGHRVHRRGRPGGKAARV